MKPINILNNLKEWEELYTNDYKKFKHINDVWKYLEDSKNETDLRNRINSIDPNKFGTFTYEVNGDCVTVSNDYDVYGDIDKVDIYFKKDKINESNLKESWSDEDYYKILSTLGISSSDAMGGIIRFNNVDIDKLIDLCEEGYADPSDRQNYGPSIQEIIDFYHYHSSPEDEVRNFLVSGYVVVPTRSDYRISVDEVSFDFDDEALDDVVDFIKNADEQSCKDNHAEAWWD